MSISQIVNSHNNFLARMNAPVPSFTGVEHDSTLSGNGTEASPLGCIKEWEQQPVRHDATLSGDGLNTDLGVVDPWNGATTNNNISGDGKTDPIGLSSAIQMGGGSITFTDGLGDVTVDATAIRNWNNNQGGGMNHVRHDDNLTGNGNDALLGLSSSVKFDSQYSWSQVNGDTITVNSKQLTSAAKVQIGTTNYGATPFIKIVDGDDNAQYIYHDNISAWDNKPDIYTSLAGSVLLRNSDSSGWAIGTGVGSGFLFNYGNGLFASKELQNKLYIYELTKDEPSVTLNLSGLGYTEVHLTTPYRYDGADPYTAVIDNKTLNLYSGAYCDLVLQDVEGVTKWCVKDSGYYIV